jgi:hypothetical protein
MNRTMDFVRVFTIYPDTTGGMSEMAALIQKLRDVRGLTMSRSTSIS